ncbi:hypothetical protein SteCoe_23925 [Stentor coeruleus]|uniref:Uncharacterized protein n=1 Tax=Stentor coeruleus TaxID=5963 RepID=A0A1R2BIP2_9CILI|nr:hypothetical protein SteCoe_23925 [Stentor coeruleus]
MDISHHHTLSWVPWNKMNRVIPSKKVQMPNPNRTINYVSNKNQSITFSQELDRVNLPKLKVQKILTKSRQVSPRRFHNFKGFTKTFSPVLERGRTSQFSYRDVNITSGKKTLIPSLA